MTLEALLALLENAPQQVEFQDVIDTIDATYHYQPTRFKNGATLNEAGSNAGSCKIFTFAQLNSLSKAQTLACFGHYYRDDVLQHPDASDHANIRNFMSTGWDGIQFDGVALTPITDD